MSKPNANVGWRITMFQKIEEIVIQKLRFQIKMLAAQKVAFRYAFAYKIVIYDKRPSSGDKLPDKFIFSSSLQKRSP
jgi:protein tyrosine/serine phosphatase